MELHLYASLVPEALLVSMLAPEEFGAYYAVGTRKKSKGQAMFFEVDPAFRDPFFRIDEGMKRCVPHANGDPKHSLYVSIYRVVEHLPVSALGPLYLATSDGRVAGLEKAAPPANGAVGLHLYQEICPVNPMVASSKGPAAFYDYMTNRPDVLISLPALCFADLALDALATDPEHGDAGGLPYGSIDHLRQCLLDVQTSNLATKMVNRNASVIFPYRTLRTGLYFGKGRDLAYYPVPSKEDLLGKHYAWWRSAQA